MKTNIDAVVTFTQSKTYPTDWKVRTEYKNTKNLITIITVDEISKDTKFGIKPDFTKMKEYAREKAKRVLEGFEAEGVVTFNEVTKK